MLTQPVLPRIRLALILLSFAGLQILLTMHLRMSSLPAAEPEKAEAFNPKLFQLMSFGQLPAVVDWMWLKTLEDPILTHVRRGEHPAIYYTLDVLTDLDPAFMQAYTAGATLVSVVRDDGPGALHLALKGERFRREELPKLPEEFKARNWQPEWSLPMLLAYVYLFDMEDMPHAITAFHEASGIPGSPRYLQFLMKQFSEPDGPYRVGMRLLGHMIEGTKDPDVKDRLAEKRRWLEVNLYLRQINANFKTFAHARNQGLRSIDPWGGHLSLNEQGKIVTTTPHRKVLGLE